MSRGGAASFVGRVHSLQCSGGGVPKTAVTRAAVRSSGMEGDRQRHLEFHGGPERALCLYSLERIEALRGEGHPISPGSTGENVTIAGLPWELVIPGARLRLGAVAAEVTSYSAPCRQIRESFHAGDFSRISERRHPGWSRVYVRILDEGDVAVEDTVELEPANMNRN